MYAIIASGGKQEKVAKGQQVHVELLDAQEGSEVKFTPIMLVDGSTILTTPAQLAKSSVTAKVMGIAAGPKIDGFTYKRRTNQRRRFGHRQKWSILNQSGSRILYYLWAVVQDSRLFLAQSKECFD